ncbi:hypothetical protein BC628DRAFT_1421375 [Trametes gibbosa]|nr:hypothetical protein BC628DRAFT_1421375 [Trametes gibbosa]
MLVGDIDMEMGGILVVNASSKPVHVFVSKYTNKDGTDAWYPLAPGGRDTWIRSGYEVVGFKVDTDSEQAGVYVKTNTEVTFHGLANITVS